MLRRSSAEKACRPNRIAAELLLTDVAKMVVDALACIGADLLLGASYDHHTHETIVDIARISQPQTISYPLCLRVGTQWTSSV
jgi:hypothetical protein